MPLVGVPGIGKSRVVWELFQEIEARDEPIAWRQGGSLPYAEGINEPAARSPGWPARARPGRRRRPRGALAASDG